MVLSVTDPDMKNMFFLSEAALANFSHEMFIRCGG
jgi:hypothetical protein